jgi:FkbM family methyltransferase
MMPIVVEKRIRQVKALREMQQNIKNWYVIPFFRLGLLKKTTFAIKNGERVEIKNLREYYNFFSGEKWWRQKMARYKDRITISRSIVTFDKKLRFRYYTDIDLGQTLWRIYEIFINNEYKVDVKNRVVINIGANIADTAIRFILDGAEKVIGYEPFPNSFKLAQENIKLNNLQNRITLINAGLGKKSSVVRLPESSLNTTVLSAERMTKIKGKKVKIITLGDIARRLPRVDTIIEMDCEGCEYPTILTADNDTLRHFSEFILEYHRAPGTLLDKFKDAGFIAGIEGTVIHAVRED